MEEETDELVADGHCWTWKVISKSLGLVMSACTVRAVGQVVAPTPGERCFRSCAEEKSQKKTSWTDHLFPVVQGACKSQDR